MTLQVDESPAGIDPARFLGSLTSWSAGLGAVAVLVAVGVGTWQQAAGVAVGCALGWANLRLTARALQAIIARPEQHRAKRALPPAGLLLKWPALLAVLAVILLYAPVAPEGVAGGIAVSLAAACVAAVRNRGTAKPS